MSVEKPKSIPPTSSRSRRSDCCILAPQDQDAWEKTIALVDETSKFLCQDWMGLVEKTYGYEKRLIVLKEGSKVLAVMPFMIVKSLFTGTRAMSLPFFDICRAYSPNPQHVPVLYKALKQRGQIEGWDYLELRGDTRKLSIQEPSLSFYNHVVDLSQGPEAVFANMASSTRRAIRKAQKSSVRIEFSRDFEALKGFYRLQCLTRKRHGLPPQPFKFFRNLHEDFIEKGEGLIIQATANGRLAASSIYLQQSNVVHYKYGASDTQHQGSRCNNYVMWSAMKHFSQKGFQNMDLGRNSLDNAGLRRYKLSWGSKEQLTHYHRYNLKTGQIMKMTDNVYGWHNRIFSLLPRPLSQLAGTLLYKHIA